MQIDRNPTTGDITLSQRAYCKCMIKCFNMENCSLKSTLLLPGLLLTTNNYLNTLDEITKMKDTLYWEVLGSLIWLQVAIWPDISYAVTLLSHFVHNPKKLHWSIVKHVLAYIKGTLDYGITYRADGELSPTRYINSNFTGYKDTYHSTKGNIFIVAGGPVSWERKGQEIVTLSIVVAEYMGFFGRATQALWISKYLSEIRLPISRPIMIHVDNNRSISYSLNNKNHWRTKHIDVWHHFIKDQVK